MIFVGTCNEEVGSVLVQRLMESSDTELEQPTARLVSLGLGLLFIGKNEKADAMMEVGAQLTTGCVCVLLVPFVLNCTKAAVRCVDAV